MKTEKELMAEALGLQGVRVKRISHLKGAQFLVSAEWAHPGMCAQNFQFLATISDTMGSCIPIEGRRHKNSLLKVTGHRFENEYPDVSEWSVQKVVEAGYPLYIHSRWLKEKMDEGLSFEAIAQKFGYDGETVRRWAEAHGHYTPSTRKNMKEKKTAVLADWKTGEYTKKQLAEKHGVSIGSVSNWTKKSPS